MRVSTVTNGLDRRLAGRGSGLRARTDDGRSADVSRHRHRHDVGQDPSWSTRRQAVRHGNARRSPCRGRSRAGRSRIPSAGGPRSSRHARLPERAQPGRDGGRAGHRPVGPDAWGDAARCAPIEVLRPAILWNDGRAAAECAELEAACPEARAITGNIAMPGFTAPKLPGCASTSRRCSSRSAKVLLPKDYVRLRLTGDYVVRHVGRVGHLLARCRGAGLVATRCWPPPASTAAHMPRLVEGTEPTGRLRDGAAARWGMARAPVVAGGGGDNAASACGIGAVTPGSAFLSLGTSGVLFVSNARFSPNTAGAVHAFCHALPDTWHQMGVILSATDSLNWLARMLDGPAPVLAAELGETVASPSPVAVPALSVGRADPPQRCRRARRLRRARPGRATAAP